MSISPEVQREAERLERKIRFLSNMDTILEHIVAALQSAHDAAKAGWQQERAELIEFVEYTAATSFKDNGYACSTQPTNEYAEVRKKAKDLLAKLDTTPQAAESTPRVENDNWIEPIDMGAQ